MKSNLICIAASAVILLSSAGCAARQESVSQIPPIGTKYRIITKVGDEVQAEKTIEIRWNARTEETHYLNRQLNEQGYTNNCDSLRL